MGLRESRRNQDRGKRHSSILIHLRRREKMTPTAIGCYEPKMRRSLVAFALLVCASAARAETVEPLLERPLVVPHEKVDFTLHGTYTNWGSGAIAVGTPATLTGETGIVGIDYGIVQDAQVGLALALPLNPGFSFGSVLANIAFAIAPGV